MGYFIKKLPWKNSDPKWKLQFVTYKKSIVEKEKVKEKKTWDIPKNRWAGLGFTIYMSLEEAKQRASQVNGVRTSKRQEEKRAIIERDYKGFQDSLKSYIPNIYREEFEKMYFDLALFDDEDPNEKELSIKKCRSVWKKAQVIILELKIESFNFFNCSAQIYDYFIKREYSPSYARKVIAVMNKWGTFVSYKFGMPYMAIPTPVGRRLTQLRVSYYGDDKKKRKESMPLSPEMLEGRRSYLRKENYEGLFLSVWLGLRPQEIRRLKDPETYKIGTYEGRHYIQVYQKKLRSRHPDDRWKIIPIIFKEQKRAIKIIKRGEFILPVNSTIKRHFGECVTSYGGRKGFVDLMRLLGQPTEFISQWMGHTSLERTMKNYKSREITQYLDSKGNIKELNLVNYSRGKGKKR